MIRCMQESDLDEVMRIWLEENCRSHAYIPPDYWRENIPAVAQAIRQADIWVEEEGTIRGFLGLEGNIIQGLFVQEKAQGQGIGKRLLDQAKSQRKELCLCVYEKNTRAIQFYQREGFACKRKQMDIDTGEMEWLMQWSSQEV